VLNNYSLILAHGIFALYSAPPVFGGYILMATIIRLSRGGRKKRPFYSVVVMDERKRRDGAFLEKLAIMIRAQSQK